MSLAFSLFATLVMTVTAYVPGGGYPNGGLWGAHCFRGSCKLLTIGDAACGPHWQYHSTFVVSDKEFTCFDRGEDIGNHNLDLVFESVDAANEWGVRRLEVEVWKPGAYERHLRELKRLE